MVTRRRFLILLGGGVAAAGGIAAGIAALPGEEASAFPEIVYGEERCAFCGMQIDDPRFAAAWRTAQGTERHFDDIGCMVATYRRDRPDGDTRFFVHDYRNEAWLDGTVASYLVSPEIKTPMSWAVLAVPDEDAARALPVYASGTIHAWNSLLEHLEKKS